MIETTLPPASEMYQALLDRDSAYDGVFFLGVRTTGIFCRPTCPAKKPLRENVEFFPSTRDALFAGYRPCRRCTPMLPNGGVPPWLEGLITAIERDPSRRWTDSDLRARSLDPARVRRWFKSNHGMTFHAYQRAHRLGLAMGQIQDGSDIMDTAFDHGYESLSGFRDAFERLFGDTPGRSRGSSLMVVTRVLTPLGPMLAGATDDGLCMLEFADRRMLETQIRRLTKLLDCSAAPGSNEYVEQASDELERYFEGELREFEVPLAVPGTDFQRAVWDALREIPYGETRSYADIARAVGRPSAVRAVGRTNGDNRLPIIIPCHRVVRADGSLCGYGGGLWRKRYLLELEQGGGGSPALPFGNR